MAARACQGEPADLRDHDCLPFRFHTAANLWRAGSNAWRLEGNDGLDEISVNGPFSANNADALVTAALAGLGLMLVPTWFVSDHLGDGTLRRVLTDYRVSPSDVETAVFAVYPSRRFLSPKVRAFIDFLVERLDDTR